MKLKILLLPTLMVAAFGARAAPSERGIEGHWSGKAMKGEASVPMILDFGGVETDVSGTITLPRNGRLGWPLEHVRYASGRLHAQYEDPQNPVVIEAILIEDEIEGELHYRDFRAKVSLKRGQPEVLTKGEEIAFKNGDVTLSGELFIPLTEGPHPGIVFMHGSGTGPRYPSYFHAMLFARLGITSLIFDKRGSGKSSGPGWVEVGFEELAEDGLAAARYLKTRADVDPARVGMYGISQAGWTMPMAAARSPDVRFLLIRSGGPIRLEREVRYDYEYEFKKKGYSQTEIDEAVEYMKFDQHVSRTGAGYEQLIKRRAEVRDKRWFVQLGTAGLPLPPGNKLRLWYRRVMDIDHVPIVESLNIPVLWLFGQDDGSFPVREVVPILELINPRGMKDFTITVFPGADHGIRITPPPEYPFPPSVFPLYAEGYLETISRWLQSKGLTGK